MSWRRKIRQVMACLVLQYGVLMGAPVRKEDVDELQRALHQPGVEKVDEQDGMGRRNRVS